MHAKSTNKPWTVLQIMEHRAVFCALILHVPSILGELWVAIPVYHRNHLV